MDQPSPTPPVNENKSALVVRADIAEMVVSGEMKGEVRKMKCSSKIGKTVYIAQAGTQTLIGQVTIDSCIPISYEECAVLWENGSAGICAKPDPNKTRQRYLWKFSNPLRFETPISYTHPRGAQIWVNIAHDQSS